MSDKVKLLLVDDDASMCDTFADILEVEGYEVITACDGQQALRVMKKEGIDLVLMDIRMPGPSGIDICTKMKKARPDAKVFLMTAYFTDDEVKRAEKKGKLTVFHKPLSISGVLSELRRASERTRSL